MSPASRPGFCVHLDVNSTHDLDRDMAKNAWQKQMKAVGKCNSTAGFEQTYGKRLDSLRRDIALRVFRADVEPVWEDPANSGRGAGKWTMVLPDGKTSKAAFRAVLGEMMGPEELQGVNGAISMCRRSTHVLLLWTAASEPGMGRDPFKIAELAERLSQKIGGQPLKFTFKPHTKKQAFVKGPEPVAEAATEAVTSDSDYEGSTTPSSLSESSSPVLTARSDGNDLTELMFAA